MTNVPQQPETLENLARGGMLGYYWRAYAEDLQELHRRLASTAQEHPPDSEERDAYLRWARVLRWGLQYARDAGLLSAEEPPPSTGVAADDSLYLPWQASMYKRIISRISTTPDGCWLWRGATSTDDLPIAHWRETEHEKLRLRPVARLLWMLANPSVSLPARRHVVKAPGSTCGKSCVRPSHHVLTERRTPVLIGSLPPLEDGSSPGVRCKRGHTLHEKRLYTKQGKYLSPSQRYCPTCKKRSGPMRPDILEETKTYVDINRDRQEILTATFD